MNAMTWISLLLKQQYGVLVKLPFNGLFYIIISKSTMLSPINCLLLLYPDKWLIDNKLSIHLGKTKSVLFGRKKEAVRNRYIESNWAEIVSQTSVLYLGISCYSIAANVIKMLQQIQLSWNEAFWLVCSEVSYVIGTVWNVLLGSGLPAKLRD